jgi:hypothetical protein
VLRECDEVRGQLCRDSERSRSSFTKKCRSRLRIDLLRSLSVWRSLGAVSISDFGSEYCVNRGKSRIEFTPEFVRGRCPVICYEQKVLKAA